MFWAFSSWHVSKKPLELSLLRISQFFMWCLMSLKQLHWHPTLQMSSFRKNHKSKEIWFWIIFRGQLTEMLAWNNSDCSHAVWAGASSSCDFETGLKVWNTPSIVGSVPGTSWCTGGSALSIIYGECSPNEHVNSENLILKQQLVWNLILVILSLGTAQNSH